MGAVIFAGAALSAICCFLVIDDGCYSNVVQNLASKTYDNEVDESYNC